MTKMSASTLRFCVHSCHQPATCCPSIRVPATECLHRRYSSGPSIWCYIFCLVSCQSGLRHDPRIPSLGTSEIMCQADFRLGNSCLNCQLCCGPASGWLGIQICGIPAHHSKCGLLVCNCRSGLLAKHCCYPMGSCIQIGSHVSVASLFAGCSTGDGLFDAWHHC